MEDVGDVIAPRTTNLSWGIQNKIMCQIFIGLSFCVNPRQKKNLSFCSIYFTYHCFINIFDFTCNHSNLVLVKSEKGCCWETKYGSGVTTDLTWTIGIEM